MRKTRATVYYDTEGSVICAQAKGTAFEETDSQRSGRCEDGYILTCLKKATSRNKGNSLERDVAKVFSQWLYGRPDVLSRTPLSGGWNGSKLGDICADPTKLQELKLNQPKIYVECKNRDGLLSEEFFNWLSSGSPKRISEWIEDTQKKCGENFWFLVLKGRGTDPWILTQASYVETSYKWCLSFKADGFTDYIMFPLKQLDTTFVDNLKQRILG